MKNLFLFFLFPLGAFAAAPFTHLILAEKFLERSSPINEIQRRDFIVGNLFPDIRHLGEIAREKTHEKGLSLKDIGHSSSYFTAGMRLHAFVDEIRENFAVKYGIYDSLEKWGPKYKASLLKLVEDEILYDLEEPRHFPHFFDEILDEETAWGSSLLCTERWHHFCRNYLNQRPQESFRLLAKLQLPFFNVPPHIVQLWSEEIPRLANEEIFRNYVYDLIDHFSILFLESANLGK